MIIRRASDNYFHLTVSRDELESIWNGLGWTTDQMSGVDNIDLENELIAAIRPYLYDDEIPSKN